MHHWDMPHAYVRHVTRMNESCHTYEWVTSHISMSHETHMHASHIWMSHVSYVRSDMTHSYVRHDACICVSWLIDMCDMTHSYVWHDSFIRAAWRVHMCDMTHSHVWQDTFKCLTHTFEQNSCARDSVTHVSPVWRDLFIRTTWLIHMCDVTHLHMCTSETRGRNRPCRRAAWHVRGLSTHTSRRNQVRNECVTAVCCSVLQCAAVCCSVL